MRRGARSELRGGTWSRGNSGSAGYSHADESALGARKSVGVLCGHVREDRTAVNAATATAAGTSRYGPENASTTSTAANAIPAAHRAAPPSSRTPAAVAVTYTATNDGAGRAHEPFEAQQVRSQRHQQDRADGREQRQRATRAGERRPAPIPRRRARPPAWSPPRRRRSSCPSSAAPRAPRSPSGPGPPRPARHQVGERHLRRRRGAEHADASRRPGRGRARPRRRARRRSRAGAGVPGRAARRPGATRPPSR